jgi:hypothetical protein
MTGNPIAVWTLSTAVCLCGAISLLKGRGALFLGGLITLGAVFWIAAAVRLGRPNSAWATRFYNDGKLTRSARRFAGDPVPYRKWYVVGAGVLSVLPTSVALVGLLFG